MKLNLTIMGCLLAAGTSFSQVQVPTYTVNTFAGSVPMGDGGPAASAFLRWPGPLVFDETGNLYIADTGNASVRKVTPGGLITTLAGTGEVGFSGDGGPAERAQLSANINGLALDAAGNLYISDDGNNRIRKVSAADGKISTFVEGAKLPTPVPMPVSVAGFGGIAFDGAGNLYIALTDLSQIARIARDGTFAIIAGTGTSDDTGDGGPAAEAAFVAPYQLHIDASGTLYVTDPGANRIRKITSDGIVSAFAGTGQAGFGGDGGPATQALLNWPCFMAEDARGNFYVGDNDNHRVRRIAADGTISTLGGNGNALLSGMGGPAAQAGFGVLNGLAVSSSGDLYISGPVIVVVTAADGMINVAYGQLHCVEDGNLAANALFWRPEALGADSQGNLYIGDLFRVYKIDTNGVISTVAGSLCSIPATNATTNSGDGGAATAATMTLPYAIALDASGNVYFSSGATVRRVVKARATPFGLEPGIINTVAGGGTATGDGGPATQASLAGTIYGLAVDSSGSLYISDTGNHRIRKVTPDGLIRTIAGTGTGGTSGDGGPATAAQIQQPRGLVFDAAGNLYFADYAANLVRKIAPDGTISTFAGTGDAGESGDGGPATKATLNGPNSLAIDPAGSLYIADWYDDALRVVTPDGIIHTIASGHPEDLVANASFGGDGGPAIGAHYAWITAVAFDGSGNIYVLDDWNERIRVLTPNQQ
jgi:sugar lactone lactonase YvrE